MEFPEKSTQEWVGILRGISMTLGNSYLLNTIKAYQPFDNNAYHLKVFLYVPIFCDRLWKICLWEAECWGRVQDNNSFMIQWSQTKSVVNYGMEFCLFYLWGCSMTLLRLSHHLHSDSDQREGIDHLFLPPPQNS